MSRAKSHAEPSEAPSSARDQLLQRAVRHVLARGLSDGSLRTVALELDTSHRMLIYHFGSAEGFWEAVLHELRAHDQELLLQDTAQGRMPSLEDTWAALSSERHLPRMRLLFQIYGEALKDPARFGAFLSHVVDSWLVAVAAGLQKQYGLSRAEAKREARMNLAVMRGLLLDLLTTHDHKGTTAALHEYARRVRPQESRS